VKLKRSTQKLCIFPHLLNNLNRLSFHAAMLTVIAAIFFLETNDAFYTSQAQHLCRVRPLRATNRKQNKNGVLI